MRSPDAGRIRLRRAARQAWAITASYVAGGTVGVAAEKILGSGDLKFRLDLAWLFCTVLGAVVFPCGLAFCAIGSWLVPSAFRRPRAWRAFLAGLLIATIFYSGLLHGAMGELESWSVQRPFGRTAAGAILVFATPFILGAMLGCLASWLLPPWPKRRVPGGGGGAAVLPPGASQIAK